MGLLLKLKACFIAKGYAQTYGIDYSDTFSPVAKFIFFCLFIYLVAYDWDLDQLDIRNAFLHGGLPKEVYIEQPPRFLAQREIGKVCCLRKSLYGLKHSPHAWFDEFSQTIETYM